MSFMFAQEHDGCSSPYLSTLQFDVLFLSRGQAEYGFLGGLQFRIAIKRPTYRWDSRVVLDSELVETPIADQFRPWRGGWSRDWFD